MEALIASAKKPNSFAEIVVVISNKADAEGLKKAARVGIPTKVGTFALAVYCIQLLLPEINK